MVKVTLFIFLFISQNIFSVPNWGATGHRTVGEIATKHLSDSAKNKIEVILNGASLALVSTYADEIRSDSKYDYIAPWHYVNFPFHSNYEASAKSNEGDIVVAINKCIDILKDNNITNEEKSFYLKLLVHFVGDIHMPLHVGLKEDKGGNLFQVQWFKKGTNLHRVWDDEIINQYGMSYTELANNATILLPEAKKEIGQATILQWVSESRALCIDIYNNTKKGENLSYQYMYRYTNVVREQLQKAGIRLAFVLNEIFQ